MPAAQLDTSRRSARDGASADGVDRARFEAVLEQLAAGAPLHSSPGRERTSARSTMMERVGYNNRWMMEIIISTFKRLLVETLRAVKPEYIMIEIATKIAVYNKTRDIMNRAVW